MTAEHWMDRARRTTPFVLPEDQGNPMAQRAVRWMQQNPVLMSYFYQFADEALQTRRQVGIGLITERVRWEVAVHHTSDDGFKINNNHRAYITRWLYYLNPAFIPLIKCRMTRPRYDQPIHVDHVAKAYVPLTPETDPLS